MWLHKWVWLLRGCGYTSEGCDYNMRGGVAMYERGCGYTSEGCGYL